MKHKERELKMKHVTIPLTSINGAKKLTPDQRNLLIILEDVTLRFAGFETFALSRLQEVKDNGLARSYCADMQEIIRKRMMEVDGYSVVKIHRQICPIIILY